VLALLASARLATRGRWRPQLPARIDAWQITEIPLSTEERSVIADASATGFELTNPLQERIFGRIVATASFDAFQLPQYFQYYELTAEKVLSLEGGGRALGQVFRQRGGQLRLAVLAWTQRPDGTTSLQGVPYGAARNPLSRLTLGASSAFGENRSCLVRLQTVVHPADPGGAQARRNLLSAASALRKELPGGAKAAITALEPSVGGGGKDIDYLTDKSSSEGAVTDGTLLPLKTGASWEFDAQGPSGKILERVVVGGPVTIGGVTGKRIDIFRNNKLWRREVYQEDKKALKLLAFGDGKGQLLELKPDFALTTYPAREGSEVHWKGTITIQGRTLPATGYSRISARENIVSAAGRFAAYRFDSVLTINVGEKPTHFPGIRWLAPGIGFVRRGYADEGKPAIAELKRFIAK
jgi:hypothetical protein